MATPAPSTAPAPVEGQSYTQPALQQVFRPISLIPVGLKEAALDSPTYRATATHFSDQVEMVERWLDGYLKACGKMVHEVNGLEDVINSVLAKSVPPAEISEAMIDHDYTLLALKRFGDGAREFWSHTIASAKKMENNVIYPIRNFLNGELRSFKEARRYMDQCQRNYDAVLARFASQAKTKEPSSLREDAFQLHESRKQYLKASMDLCIQAPQLRAVLDRLLVNIFTGQWREMGKSRESMTLLLGKWGSEMDRIQAWSREMGVAQSVFRRELQSARKSIEDAAELKSRPSRELDDYATSTVPFLGSRAPATLALSNSEDGPEKQGWLFMKTLTGKPTRTVWVRRWFYVRHGIFGWLVQGQRTGGVEESEKIGVLLCNIKPAFQEERRFCFEVKTKDNTIVLQAETQQCLTEWLASFESAKRDALNDANHYTGSTGEDAAFAVSPPTPEFAAKGPEGTFGHHAQQGSDELTGGGLDRNSTLPIPDGGLATRSSMDLLGQRRSIVEDPPPLRQRDHAAKIIEKLDLHRKSTAGSQLSGGPAAPPAGGIASLIAASHNILPVYSPLPQTTAQPNVPEVLASTATAARGPSVLGGKEIPTTSLAPTTMANPPAFTNLSKAAIIVKGERGMPTSDSGGLPPAMMANLWGSSNWALVNRLERGDASQQEQKGTPSPASRSGTSPSRPGTGMLGEENRRPEFTRRESDQGSAVSIEPGKLPLPVPTHRKTMSVGDDTLRPAVRALRKEEYPPNYPIGLKNQDAQFRMLFPNVPSADKVLLVFRATWNPNDRQEFPGRVYVTPNDLYFYSHHMGLVLVTSISLGSITEVRAAPAKDCDYIYLHLRDMDIHSGDTRMAIKVFLEPLRILQRRLSLLVRNYASDEPLPIEPLLRVLIKAEEEPERSPSTESWEDISISTPLEGSGLDSGKEGRPSRDLKTQLLVDRALQNARAQEKRKDLPAFKLPTEAVVYVPENVDKLALEKEFDISPKAMFHVMFGDKSAVFQALYQQRRSQNVTQGPWIHIDETQMRREFVYQVTDRDFFGRRRTTEVVDHQIIEKQDDHLCYVVTDRKTPWHLPHREDFMLVSKIVITYVAKSKCKLAIYSSVEWTRNPLSKVLVQKQALDDMDLDALDLKDVVADQARKLGSHTHTKKAVHIFGHVGHQTSVSQLPTADTEHLRLPPLKQRTLSHMFVETLGSLAESAVSSLMMWGFAGVRQVWKICTAHGILLSLLALSVLSNLLFTSRSTAAYWSERKAATFMERVGVGPNTWMSKAVYLRDLEVVAANATAMSLVPPEPGTCAAKFQDVVRTTDMDAAYQPPAREGSSASTVATARRLHRTRQHLGAYRHDLLVAMRVVNAIEREMLVAEWEGWLAEEGRRCRKIESMSKRNATEAGGPGQADRVRAFLDGYCRSCWDEEERVARGVGAGLVYR